ncbi:MAG: hypothetical protein LBU43_03020 [Candidatus Accumulibacter sp.]|nr:hypothetical protein [Accumulibacter sp.]
MLRPFLFVLLGIFLLIAGIPLMNFNFYVGLVSMGAGILVISVFRVQFMRKMNQWFAIKGEETRKKRDQNRLSRNQQ